MAIMLIEYTKGAINQLFVKNKLLMAAIIGILALHGTKVVATIVASRIERFFIIFVAIIPLTPQLEETKNEITLWPQKPNL